DRWPTSQQGWMDGPKLVATNTDGGLKGRLACLEERLYSRMPRCNVCFMVQVSAATAVERNAARVKKDKETEEEIILRHEQAKTFEPLADEIIRFDNDGEYETNKY